MSEMPKVKSFSSFHKEDSLFQEGFEHGADTQRKADMEWMKKEGFVKLPNYKSFRDKMEEYIPQSIDAKQRMDADCQELYRWLKGGK
jgi:hypothetical protein